MASATAEYYFRFRISWCHCLQFGIICMLLCIILPNFVQIGSSTAEIWRHIHFSRWRPRRLNTTSGFVFVDVTAFRRSKFVNKPNFVDLCGHHNINLWLRYNDFWFGKTNVYHIGILLPVTISTIFPLSTFYSASAYRISSKSEQPLRKYNVILLYQDGGRDSWILLPVLYQLMSLPSEGQSLLANRILSRYIKWRLSITTSGFEIQTSAILPIAIWTSLA